MLPSILAKQLQKGIGQNGKINPYFLRRKVSPL